MTTSQSHFKDRQAKILWEKSQEYKDLEKARQNASKRAYYEDIAWQIDRMYDGSDEQPYEPDVKEFDNV